MPRLNNGSVTLGWDSIGSGVDEVELKRPAIADKPAERDYQGFERLVDIAGIVSRARLAMLAIWRTSSRPMGSTTPSFANSTHLIADQTLATVPRLA